MGFEQVNYKSKTGCRGTINQLSWKFECWTEVHCLFGEGKDQVVKTITEGECGHRPLVCGGLGGSDWLLEGQVVLILSGHIFWFLQEPVL